MGPDAIMIFAAGFGTRMRHLTADRPKPMVPLCGRPMIDHALDLAREAGINRMVANTHYLGHILRDHLVPQGVRVINEMPDILDTGGGLRNAGSELGSDTVFTMNPDAIWRGPNPLTALAQAWDPARMDALLMCVPMEQVHGREGDGDFALDDDGKLHRKGSLVYGGVQIINTDSLASINETVFSLNVVWDQMLQARTLHGLRYGGEWCDVGNPEGLNLAEAMLNRSADV